MPPPPLSFQVKILREAAAGSCSEAFQSGIGVPSAVVFMLPAVL